MENIKNRIITLSGQPATGKSTVKNILIQKYKDEGYEVKEFATGDKFREYFNDMIELLKVIKNKDYERFNELSQREGIRKVMYDDNGKLKPESVQMIHDTLQTMKERNFDFDSFDIEKANNSQSLSGIRKELDKVVDNYIKDDLRNQINAESNPNVIWIIDSRLAWHNIPKDESLSVRLVADEKIAGERAYKRFLKSFDELLESISQCEQLNTANTEIQVEKIDRNPNEKLSNKEKLQIKFDVLEKIIKECPEESVKSEYLSKLLKVKEESYESLEKAIEKIRARRRGENERYKRRYNVDLDDESNYALVVDTSHMAPEEEASLIFETEQKFYTKEGYKNGENVGWDR